MNSELENAYRGREPQRDWSHRETADEARTRESAYETMLLEAVGGRSRPEIEKRMNAPAGPKSANK